MAAKRPALHVHASRQDQVPREPPRKRQKPDNAGPKSFKKAHPVNELKSQLRSLQRLLDRNDDLPATVRVEKERALQTAKHELQQAENAKRRREMIGRYHKIRFFDRQKATKRLKRARKELQSCEDEGGRRVELAKAVEEAEVDVNYAQYYPLDQPYVSLFPRKTAKEGDDDHGSVEPEEPSVVERQGDPAMWQRVRLCMAEGTLDALREGKLMQTRDEDEATQTRTEDVKSRGRREGNDKLSGPREDVQKESDEESDGGFFE